MGLNGEYKQNSTKQVQACFITKLEAPLKLPLITIAVPANATRIVLSEIVNKLLIEGDIFFISFLFVFVEFNLFRD